MVKTTHAQYLRSVFVPKDRRQSLKVAKAKFARRRYDGIVVMSSVSGMFGALLAHALNKKLVVVRKEGVYSHSEYKVENVVKGDKLLFVDDCIASGRTLRLCREGVEAHGAKVVGAYMYYADNHHAPKWFAVKKLSRACRVGKR